MDARPKRRSIRLRGYDYSRVGAYFVSICTKDRKCLFGDIENQEMERPPGEHTGSPLHHVIQWFKTMTTNEYIRGVKQYGWVPFPGRLWQRNYYEHILRNENEMSRIRKYIRNNPV